MPKLKANGLEICLEYKKLGSSYSEKTPADENEYPEKKKQQVSKNEKTADTLNINSVQDPIDHQPTSILSKTSGKVLKMKKFSKIKKSKMKVLSPTEASSPKSLLLFEKQEMPITTTFSESASNGKLNKNRKTKGRKKKAREVNEKCNTQNDKLNIRENKCGDKTTNGSSNNTPRYFSNLSKKSKLGRCVVFTNEVMVIHFNNERVIFESTEPLKKELDQQIRNKEMRKGCKFVN